MPRLADAAAGLTRGLPYATAAVKSAPEVMAVPKRAKRQFPALKLTAQERRDLIAIYGPILSLEQAAAIAGLAPSTLKRHLSETRYKNAALRGKPTRFLTDRFIQELFARSCR